ncbi:hypothetical protein CHUAL_011238 [Chamberlinius hualienensis]
MANHLELTDKSHRCSGIIIGAGAAGIGAAHYLIRHGIKDIAVLESSDRIGGRIQTVSFGSAAENIVELGANWIHGGTISNPFFTAAIERGFVEKNGYVPILDRFRNCAVGKSDGKLVDLPLGQKAISAFFEAEREAYNLYFKKSIKTDNNINLCEYLNSVLQIKLSEFPLEERDDVKCVFNALRNYLAFHTGDNLSKLSAKYYGTFQEIPGNDVMIPGGLSNLLSTFADELKPHCSIHYNTVVSRIEWPSNGFGKVHVHCKDGSVWSSDYVIVTISLGYLKQHHDTIFNPPLPVSKQDAIEKLGFGNTNKIFLEFSKPFWKAGLFGSIVFGWNDEEFQTDRSSHWEKSVYGFDEVYNNPNVLVGWIAGSASLEMEAASDDEVMAVCVNLIRRFTGNPNIPSPRRMWRTKWCSDQWACGSYTHVTNNSCLKEIRNLAQPLPNEKKPVVLFAGEATHDNYYSTIHGALLTGIREAQRIISTNNYTNKISDSKL